MAFPRAVPVANPDKHERCVGSKLSKPSLAAYSAICSPFYEIRIIEISRLSENPYRKFPEQDLSPEADAL